MTEFVPAVELAAPLPMAVPVDRRSPFGAALAFAIFLLYLFAQVIASFVAVFIAALVTIIRNGGALPAADAIVPMSLAIATPLAFGAGAIVIAGATLLWTRHLFEERGPRGLGWRRGALRQHLLAALGGIVMAAFWMLALKYVLPPISPKQYGPFAQMLTGSTWSRAAVAFVGVAMAPPIEELLFRGILLAGFARRFGVIAGCVISTTLFVTLHLGETIHYLPALGAIAVVGVVLLLIRLRSDSIVVAMIFHATYNAALIGTTIF